MPVIADTVIVGGAAVNGATVKAYKASRFGGVPAYDASPPGGGVDAGPVTSGTSFGGTGEFQITVPTDEDYYLAATYGGHTAWQFYPSAAIDDVVQVYNVKTYGAKGDGVTDDTTAIQSAINAAGAAGGIVYLPPGAYVTSSALTVNSPEISFTGAGSVQVKILPTVALTGNAIRVQMNPWTAAKCGTFGGFTIDGTNAGAGAVGLHYGDAVGGTLRDLVVQNFATNGGIGIHIDNVTHWTERTVLHDVQCSNNTSGVVFDVNGGTSSWAYTDIEQLTFDVSAAQTAMTLKGGGTLYNSKVRTRGNVNGGTGNTAVWLWVTGSSNITNSLLLITGEQTTGTGATAIKIDAGSKIAGSGVVELHSFTTDAITGTFISSGYLDTPSMGWGSGGYAFATHGGSTHIDSNLEVGTNLIVGGGASAVFGHQSGNNSTLGGTWYSGIGVPSGGLGANGDFYQRTDTPSISNQRLYVKSAGAWAGII